MSVATDFTAEDQEIIKRVQDEAHNRVAHRLSQVTDAVTEFHLNSGKHIDDHLRGLTGDAQFSFGTVVDSMIHIVASVLIPEVEVGKAIMDQAKEMMVTGLKDAIAGAEAGGKHAIDRLHKAVDALSYQISYREGQAIALVQHQVDQVVIDHFDDWGNPEHTDTWRDWMCDQLGFHVATRENVYDPVRQWLEYEFIGLLVQVQGELTQAAGYTNAHDSGSPEQWSTRARLDEQRLYNKEGEAAWEDAYKMSDQ
jgi:hypothetical protein